MEKVSLKSVLKNCFLSIVVQLVSLITSFVLGFIVPKFIHELDYAYWQMYTMYVTYSGVLHFGILDGLILRYAGTDYADLDRECMRSQLTVVFLLNALSAVGMSFVAYHTLERNYFIIVALFAVAVITKNVFLYFSYLLQITNRIKYYAKSVIVQRGAYLVAVAVLLLAGAKEFYWYCLADIVGDLCGILCGAFYNKGLYLGRLESPAKALRETWRNFRVGVFLLIANFSSMFIAGGAKLIIQMRWGDLVFGKASFSFSVVNIFISFVAAISIVLFPSLKRLGTEELAPLYAKIRNVISPMMFVALLGYFPLAKILAWWLPHYAESVVYLGVLLPMMIFTSKVGILTDNYLKAYRRERMMLWVNLACMTVALVAFVLGAYVFDQLDIVIYAVVFAVMLRSVISEILVTRIVGKVPYFDFVIELIMSLGFIAVARYLSLLVGFLVYLAIVALYVVLKRKALLAVLAPLWRSLRGKKAPAKSEEH